MRVPVHSDANSRTDVLNRPNSLYSLFSFRVLLLCIVRIFLLALWQSKTLFNVWESKYLRDLSSEVRKSGGKRFSSNGKVKASVYTQSVSLAMCISFRSRFQEKKTCHLLTSDKASSSIDFFTNIQKTSQRKSWIRFEEREVIPIVCWHQLRSDFEHDG